VSSQIRAFYAAATAQEAPIGEVAVFDYKGWATA
jgi:hypothetical protein